MKKNGGDRINTNASKILNHEHPSTLPFLDRIEFLLERVPESLISSILDVQAKMPGMLALPEHSIRKKVKPTELDDTLRFSFWNEFNRAMSSGRPMKLENVLKGVCSHKLWNASYVGNRHKILWIITPPKSYSLAMRQLAYRGLQNLESIVEQSLAVNDGDKVNHDAIDQALCILECFGHRY